MCMKLQQLCSQLYVGRQIAVACSRSLVPHVYNFSQCRLDRLDRLDGWDTWARTRGPRGLGPVGCEWQEIQVPNLIKF